MEEQELINFIKESDARVCCDFAASLVGYVMLEDDLCKDYSKEYLTKVFKMQNDRNYQKERGSWSKFEEEERALYVERYMSFLKDKGYMIDSFDFINDTTCFIWVKEL